MFEIRCIVGDKKLVEVLTLLHGQTLEPPVVLPVKTQPKTESSVHANGHDKPKAWTLIPGGSISLLRKFVKGRKSVSSQELRLHCQKNGYSKNGYSYSLSTLLKEGVLKKSKTPRLYEVVH